jgi:protease-4
MDGLMNKNHIATLTISNVILNDHKRNKILSDLVNDNSAKALIVYINSPGGTVVGGETLYYNLRAIGEKKPIVTVIGDLATSAGYMAAIASDQIYARESSITGSIGVILQSANITGLLEKIGIKAKAIKSSELKAQPNPFEPFSEDANKVTQALVADIYEMFVDMVADRRKFTKENALRLADGRVYTGRQALKNGLIDGIGGEKEALNWLKNKRNIDIKLPLKPIVRLNQDKLIRNLFGGLVQKIKFYDRLGLDGLISLWQPLL